MLRLSPETTVLFFKALITAEFKILYKELMPGAETRLWEDPKVKNDYS
jgi:hypothetical protein